MLMRLAGRCDEITAAGLFVGVVWTLISVAWTSHWGPGQLLWLCDIATLGTAVGMILRSRLILTAQLCGMAAYHLAWQVDFISYALCRRMPLGATAYMFSGTLSIYEKALSSFQHIFLVPACLWALWRLGSSRSGWILQSVQAAVAFGLTYLFTRPEENINWVFGAGFASLSPASVNPVVYYTIMVAVSPALLYFPINRIASRIVGGRPRRDATPAPQWRAVAGVALTLATMILSGLIALACQPVHPVLEAMTALTPSGPTVLERTPVESDSPRIVSIEYGLPGRETAISLLPIWHELPRESGPGRTAGALLLSRITTGMAVAGIPKGPQEVVVRGRRGKKGTVVCGYVGADRFYAQPPCDSETAVERFELHCHLGRAGLAEFVHEAGFEQPLLGNQILEDGAVESLFGVAAVAFDRHGASRTPIYLMRRTGVYLPDDVIWSGKDGHSHPRLR